MDEQVVNFIRANRIDSFQKLRIVLFLYERTGLSGTCQELARQLYLGDELLVRKIMTDLQSVGLLVVDEFECCGLVDQPEIKISLQRLFRAFEAPLTRQKILEMVNTGSSSHWLKQIDVFNINTRRP